MHPNTMHCLTLLLGVFLSLFFQPGQCLPTGRLITIPGRSQPAGLVSTTDSTDANIIHPRAEASASANPNIGITIHNTVSSGENLWIYIAGDVDTSGSQSMLLPDGTWYALNAGGSSTPVNVTADVGIAVENGKSSTITLPSYVSSARLYAFESAQMDWQMVGSASGVTTVVQPVVTEPGTPAYDNRWGFAEFTSNDEEFFVNLSFVDFVSLAFGMSVTDEGGVYHSVPGLMQTLPGTNSSSGRNASSTAAEQICAGLEAQSKKDGNAWDELCIYSNSTTTSEPSLLRVLSPQEGAGQNIAFAGTSYYDPYIAAVWAHYTAHPLRVDTQGSGAVVSCQVDAGTGELVCAGSTTRMPRPTTADVWGCNSGAFAVGADADDTFKAVVPRVCAALTRSTLLVDGGDL